MMLLFKKSPQPSNGSAVYELFGCQDAPKPMVVLAGPCVIESEDLCFEVAAKLRSLKDRHGLPVIFKASFDKANRTSLRSFRGPGLAKGMEILGKIKQQLDIPILTDIHSNEQADAVKGTADIIQIPAFLCRQTDLLVAAAKTGTSVNIKKGQFMAPWDMQYSIEKVREAGNEQVLVTERGTMFGYNNLVVDMCSIPVLRDNQVPVIFDATHSVQKPGGAGECSGGDPRFIRTLAKAAASAEIDGLFLEVHPQPQNALCDASNSLPLAELEDVLVEVAEIDQQVKKKSPAVLPDSVGVRV